jgi:transposase InsO family protein
VAYYATLGIPIRRLLTDNDHCYRSAVFRQACQLLGLRHHFTRPYTPRTNGKAERFIQTALRESVYARAYATSEQRTAHLPSWLHHYNWHRPHASLQHAPPISRSGLDRNNLLRLHSWPPTMGAGPSAHLEGEVKMALRASFRLPAAEGIAGLEKQVH